MLTKEERAAIAESLKKYGEGGTVLYDCLLGVCVPRDTSPDEDRVAIANRIIDLCDTSNMLELPIDKDGEIIHIGDVVYDNNGKKYNVDGYVMHSACKNIIRVFNSNSGLTNRFASGLTHKKPVTIASLVGDIKHVANQGQVDRKVYEELFRIAWALESLGDSDD